MMTAVDFLATLERMCWTYTECSEGCPLNGKCYLHDFSSCGLRLLNAEESTTNNHKEEVIRIVEQWDKDHPVKIRQSELLKMFPYADMCNDIVNICPMKVNNLFRCDAPYTDCTECRKKYWLEEVE